LGVLQICQGGMEYTRASTLWKFMMNPNAVEMNDVIEFFYKYTNPSLYFANSGCQWLAVDLNKVHEGVEHNYVIASNVLIILHIPMFLSLGENFKFFSRET